MSRSTPLLAKSSFYVALSICFCISIASEAVAQSAMPPFTGQRISVADTDAAPWQSLEQYIRDIEKQSQQAYFVVVVKNSGSGSRATVTYTDKLQAAWIQQANQQSLTFDPQRAVLIVLDLKNRQLSVNTGPKLQQEYGLRGQTIDRQLVAPYFVPLARANNYVEGLKILIAKFEERIAAQDQADQNKQQQSAARLQQVRQDATEAISSARTLSAKLQLLISEQTSSGLDLSRSLQQAVDTQQQLESLSATASTDPVATLKKAAAYQKILETIRDDVRSMAANQIAAVRKLADVRKLEANVAEQIEKTSREGLAVTHIGKKLDEAAAALRSVEAMATSNPTDALQMIEAQAAVATALLDEVNNLPLRKQGIEDRLQAAATARLKAEAELSRAEAFGVDVAEYRQVLQNIDETMTDAKLSSVWDYDATEAHLNTVDENLQSQTTRLSAAADDRYFKTRTLPKAVAVVVGSIIALVLLVLRFLHLRLRWPLEKQLKDYKTKVVDLSDSLDALKHRHKMLPFTDSDFAEPMSGETLTTYTSIQESLDRYRVRWLALMDTWQAVQRSLDNEHFFGRKSLAAAQVQLDTAPVDDVIESIRDNCAEMLDVLENAHETQVATAKQLEESLVRLGEQIDGVKHQNLSTDCYQLDLAAALQKRDAVEAAKVADPIGNKIVLNAVLEEVVRIGKWTEQILHHHSGAEELATKLEDVAQLTAKHRDMGFRFSEEGTDPAALFTGIRHHHSECLNLLNRGEAKTAAEHLTQGFGLVASANERIERQVFCRDFCDKESTLRSQQQDRLRTALVRAEQSFAELQRSFNDNSFSDIAGNPQLAEQAIEACNRLLSEAKRNGDEDVQLYVTATEQYEQIQQQQNETALLIEAVDQRLQELVAMRDQVQQNAVYVTQFGSSVRQLLDSSAADRPAANQRFRHAEAALAEARSMSLAGKPEWQRVVDHLNLAQREFENSKSMAEQDQRLAQQAYSELNHAESQIRGAQSFYSLGFRAETSLANSQYQQAQQLLRSQDYEACIRLSNLAVASARDAINQAESLARAKQREQERRRQRQLAAVAAAAAAANRSSSVGSQSRSFGRSGFGLDSSSGSFSSGTSSSSWESGTSSSSW